MINTSEIQALIKLLDDDDKEVFRHVHNKIKSYGPEVISTLENAWGTELDPSTHARLEQLIREIQLDDIIKQWANWLADPQPDLLTGAYLVARYHYPELQQEDVQKKLFKIRQTVWLELNYNQTPLEQIHIFNQVFYNYFSFKGLQASEDYQDFCINHVLDTKKGHAITVGIIYQLLAHELNLPVYGVNLLQHYILAFCKKMIYNFDEREDHSREVMFYINPVNRGSIFSRTEIKDYLDKMKEDAIPAYFSPASNKDITAHLLQYLIDIYNAQNRTDRAADLATLLQKLKEA